MRGNCRHCGKNRSLKSRALCDSCYNRKVIRAQYPCLKEVGRGSGDHHDETLEELEALIDSRRATMPPNLEKSYLHNLGIHMAIPDDLARRVRGVMRIQLVRRRHL